MPPMTRTMSPNGVPGAANAAYYQRRAKGGVGLIITEGPGSRTRPPRTRKTCPRMYGDDALDGWTEVVRAVHAEGTPIFSQLWHVGQMKQPVIEGLYAPRPADYVPPRRVGPSGLFGGIG